MQQASSGRLMKKTTQEEMKGKRSTQGTYDLHRNKKLRPHAHDILRGKQWHIQNTPLGDLCRGQKVLPQSCQG